jgi:hypothetical protein
MQKLMLALFFFALFVALAGLAIRSWRQRGKQQAQSFSAPLETLPITSELLNAVGGQYVSTTFFADPLNRVSAHGLGVRGKTRISVFATGIELDRKGERSLAMELTSIDSFQFAQATIDRVVEANGLLQINWHHENSLFSTFLRVANPNDRARLQTALETLAIGSTTK